MEDKKISIGKKDAPKNHKKKMEEREGHRQRTRREDGKGDIRQKLQCTTGWQRYR